MGLGRDRSDPARVLGQGKIPSRGTIGPRAGPSGPLREGLAVPA